MKTTIISLLLAAGFFTLVSCTQSMFVSEKLHMHEKKKEAVNDEIPETDRVKSLHKLMQAIKIRIEELPEDSRFGSERVLAFHGETAFLSNEVGVDGYNAFQNLAEKNEITITTFGQFDENSVPGRSNPIPVSLREGRFAVQFDRRVHNTALIESHKLVSSNETSRVIAVKEALIELQKIFATHDKCYACHKDVLKGNPIGVVAIEVLPKESAID